VWFIYICMYALKNGTSIKLVIRDCIIPLYILLNCAKSKVILYILLIIYINNICSCFLTWAIIHEQIMKYFLLYFFCINATFWSEVTTFVGIVNVHIRLCLFLFMYILYKYYPQSSVWFPTKHTTIHRISTLNRQKNK